MRTHASSHVTCGGISACDLLDINAAKQIAPLAARYLRPLQPLIMFKRASDVLVMIPFNHPTLTTAPAAATLCFLTNICLQNRYFSACLAVTMHLRCIFV